MDTLGKSALAAEWRWVCQLAGYWKAKLPSRLIVGLVCLLGSMVFVMLYRWPHHYNMMAATRKEGELIWRNNCWDAERNIPVFRRTIDCDANKGYMEMNVAVSALGGILAEMARALEEFFTTRVRNACSSAMGFAGLKAFSDIFSFATIALVSAVLVVYFIFYQSSKNSAAMERVLENALMANRPTSFAQTNPRPRVAVATRTKGKSEEGQTAIRLPQSVYQDVECGVEINES